jgi:hypothetical protein
MSDDTESGAQEDESAEAPAADPSYDEPGDNPLAAEDDDD